MQRRQNLCRMMAVIIHDPNSPFPSLGLKAPFGAAESRHDRRNPLKRKAQIHAHCDTGQTIHHIVPSRHADGDSAQQRLPPVNIEESLRPGRDDFVGRKISRQIQCVSDLWRLHLARHRPDRRAVNTENRQPAGLDLIEKLRESPTDFRFVAVMIHVVVFDIGDNSNLRRELQKRAIAFIRFRHQQPAIADFGVATDRVEIPADQHIGIHSRHFKQKSNHRGRGGLAVGTGDCDSVALIEQCRQDVGPVENRQTDAPGFDQFRIILPDGAGYHDGPCIAEVRRRMSQINRRAAIGQTGGRFRRMQIRTGNAKPLF